MSPTEFEAARQWAPTPFAQVAYWEFGAGPPALFIHGYPLNSYQWSGAFEHLADLRRCIAPDLMGLGHTRPNPDQPLSFKDQADMLLAFMDALGLQTVDLVGNDSGCAIAQLVATAAPDRIRSLVLTNGDTHDNWPPTAFQASFEAAKAGQLADTLAGLLANPNIARSPLALGRSFQFPERLTDEILQTYLGPLVATPAR